MISSSKDISQTFQVVKLKQNKGKFSLNFSVKQFVPFLKVFWVFLVEFWDCQTIAIAFDAQAVFLDQVSEVIDFSITQENNGSVFLLNNERLVWLERGIHDGKPMEADPGLRESLKAGVVGASVL